MVTVSPEGVTRERIWDVPYGRTAGYASPADYEEELRTLFRQAVAARIDTAAPVYAELSGGLDSSSVVSMASRLIAEGSVPAAELLTVTYTQPESTDERFARVVAGACCLKAAYVRVDQYPPVTPGAVGTGKPLYWQLRLEDLHRRMRATGSSVCLTGRLGDLIMSNWLDDSEQVADYLVRGRFRKAFTEALAWSRILNRPVWPILANATRSVMNRNPETANSEFAEILAARQPRP